jgi:hypothetical protein
MSVVTATRGGSAAAALSRDYPVPVLDRVLLWLRPIVIGRKWVFWVAFVLAVLVLVQIGLSLLPHHDLNTLLKYEENPDGVRELPNGSRAGP